MVETHANSSKRLTVLAHVIPQIVYYQYAIHNRAERRLKLSQAYCSLAARLFREPQAVSTSSIYPLVGGSFRDWFSYSIKERDNKMVAAPNSDTARTYGDSVCQTATNRPFCIRSNRPRSIYDLPEICWIGTLTVPISTSIRIGRQWFVLLFSGEHSNNQQAGGLQLPPPLSLECVTAAAQLFLRNKGRRPIWERGQNYTSGPFPAQC